MGRLKRGLLTIRCIIYCNFSKGLDSVVLQCVIVFLFFYHQMWWSWSR